MINSVIIVSVVLCYTSIITGIVLYIFAGYRRKVNCAHDFKMTREIECPRYVSLEFTCEKCGDHKVVVG